MIDQTSSAAEPPVQVSFVPTVDDQVHGTLSEVRPISRGRWWWGGAMVVVLLANAAGALAREGAPALRGAAGATLLLLSGMLALWLAAPRLFRWWLGRRPPAVYSPVTVTVGPDGVRREWDLGTAGVAWTDVTRVRETKDLFLFHLAGGRVWFVPRRAMRERDDARLRALAVARLGPCAELMNPLDGR